MKNRGTYVHHIVLILSVLNLVTVGVILWGNVDQAKLSDPLPRLVADRQRLIDSLVKLDRLASDIAHDARVEDERTAHVAVAARAIRQQLANIELADRALVIRRVDATVAAIARMSASIDSMRAANRAGDPAKVLRALVEAHRHQARAHDLLMDARRAVRMNITHPIRAAHAGMDRIEKRETVLAALIVLTAAPLVWYGYRSSRVMVTACEREKYVASLQERERELAEHRDLLEQAERIAGLGSFEWVPDQDDRILFSNGLCAIYGISRANVTATFSAYRHRVHHQDRAIVDAAELQARAGQPFAVEHRLVRIGGEIRVVRAEGRTVQKDGRNHVVGVVQDITARRQAEESLQQLSRQNALVLNSAVEGIAGLDLHGSIAFISEAGARMLGWTAAQLVGRDLHAEIGSDHPIEKCPIIRKVRRDGATVTGEQEFRARSGETIPVEFSTAPMFDDAQTIVGIVLTFRDISHRKAVERMKDEFISTVSHELRTPLTSIRGALGLLAADRLGMLPEKGQRLLEIAAANADRLVRLVNDILGLERIASGKVELDMQRCEGAALVEEAIDAIRPLAERDRITIVAEIEKAPLIADGDRIIRTLTNLLGNAVKFSPAGAVVRVGCTTVGADVVFSVADNGRGIPRGSLDSVFERFRQVDASDSREKGGSGLGLAIARSIVRQHGGEIGVESHVGVGSTFTFTIPSGLAAPSSAPARKKITVSPDGAHDAAKRRPRILLVEDDLELADVLEASFDRLGIDTLRAADGRTAVELAASGGPDLIVLDLLLPEIDGYGVVERLKWHDVASRLPLVIYSAAEPTLEQKERLHLGPTDYLTKSAVTPEAFEQRVLAVLGTLDARKGIDHVA